MLRSCVFEDFASCVRERRRFQKNIKHEKQSHPKIDEQIHANSMLEKLKQQTWKIIKSGTEKGAKNNGKSINKKRCEN